MAEYKLVISDPKTGKAYGTEVKEAQADAIVRKKLGDSIPGDKLGMVGYELKIAGGSDKSGFPMRHGYHGVASKRLLLAEGVGFNSKRRGAQARKRVCGDTITENTSQINLIVEKSGAKKLEDLFKKAEESEEKKE